MRYAVNGRFKVRQAALFCYYPFIRITVAVEDNTLVILDDGNQQGLQCIIKLVSRNAFHFICDIRKLAGYNCIQQGVRATDVVGRTNHTEFKTVASEGKRRSTVPVSRILREVRQRIYADFEYLGFALIGSAGFQCIQNTLEFFTHKDGDDCWRCFVCTQTVIIAGRRSTDAEQVCVLINTLDNCAQEGQELHVFHRCAARIQQVLTVIGCHRPVVVLTGAIDTCKRLFMQQANQTVLQCNLFHDFHCQFVLVGRNVGGGENRSHFVLCRSYFIVFCGCKNANLPQSLIQISHICSNAGL